MATQLPAADEEARLQALAEYRILDSDAESAFDDIALLAGMMCGAPVATVTLVDRHRQWFKASIGMGVRETPRSASICAIAIRDPDELLEIEDVSQTLDIQPRDLQGERLRFYAGVPIVSPGGHALGTVCVLDHAPRTLSDAQRDALRALGRQVERLLALRMYADERDAETRVLRSDREDLQRRNADLRRLASHDPLTGLLNRNALEELRTRPDAMQHLYAEGYVLGMVDIDHFKQVNDRHGHSLGDVALRAVADAITASIRDSDIAVRFGGEEFLLVFPRTPLAGAYQVATRLREAVAGGDLPFRITVSIGLAAGDPQRDTPEQVFERADQALYRAKAAGRDRVVADDTQRH